ncbi:MAG: regulatory protein GemA [Alphaproteobacteria bacterium]|nr:regulatory protein GemA [Alphaproteobacteria bacterium]
MKPLRNIMIAKIHLAKNQLGLDDDTYRSIIQQAVGKDSSAKCTDKQLEKVIEKLKEKGWKDEKPRKAGDKTRKERKSYEKPNKPSISKIYALWGVLQRSGKIKSKDKTALDVFVRKYTGVDHVKWLDEVQAQKIIEILKQMIAR